MWSESPSNTLQRKRTNVNLGVYSFCCLLLLFTCDVYHNFVKQNGSQRSHEVGTAGWLGKRGERSRAASQI